VEPAKNAAAKQVEPAKDIAAKQVEPAKNAATTQVDPALIEQAQIGAFPNPPELRDAVRFWHAVFSEHASDKLVMHDRQKMDVIWNVVQLPKNEEGEVERAQLNPFSKAQNEVLIEQLRYLAKHEARNEFETGLKTKLKSLGKDGATAWRRVRSQRGVADKFSEGLERSKKWAENIRSILRDAKVPELLIALPFVESMFRPDARSSAGALGLWQLMPATARDLGLKVRRSVDERKDIRKATQAAARMLMQNHKFLGSWPLAITGYNHGPYGVKRAVKKVGSSNLVDLINNYKKSSWGFASKNFYAEFIAVLAILSEHQDHPANPFNQAVARTQDTAGPRSSAPN
jgi:membrane-bound lytic murein transglycosylase D